MSKIDIQKRVISFKPEDANWPFEGKPNFTYKRKDHDWQYRQEFTPFPCYSHNRDLVIKEVRKMEAIFPIKFNPYYFLLPYDTESYVNGWADRNNIWDDKEKIGEQHGFRPNITLSGKRIPLHPAMTRYLCNHEYGHLIDYYIQYNLGLKEESVTDFDRDYAKLRKIECCSEYGGLRWHKAIGEIICNDIRICLLNSEIEFWPHDCEHPLKNKKIIKFWNEMKEKYAYK